MGRQPTRPAALVPLTASHSMWHNTSHLTINHHEFYLKPHVPTPHRPTQPVLTVTTSPLHCYHMYTLTRHHYYTPSHLVGSHHQILSPINPITHLRLSPPLPTSIATITFSHTTPQLHSTLPRPHPYDPQRPAYDHSATSPSNYNPNTIPHTPTTLVLYPITTPLGPTTTASLPTILFAIRSPRTLNQHYM